MRLWIRLKVPLFTHDSSASLSRCITFRHKHIFVTSAHQRIKEAVSPTGGPFEVQWWTATAALLQSRQPESELSWSYVLLWQAGCSPTAAHLLCLFRGNCLNEHERSGMWPIQVFDWQAHLCGAQHRDARALQRNSASAVACLNLFLSFLFFFFGGRGDGDGDCSRGWRTCFFLILSEGQCLQCINGFEGGFEFDFWVVFR